MGRAAITRSSFRRAARWNRHYAKYAAVQQADLDRRVLLRGDGMTTHTKSRANTRAKWHGAHRHVLIPARSAPGLGHKDPWYAA